MPTGFSVSRRSDHKISMTYAIPSVNICLQLSNVGEHVTAIHATAITDDSPKWLKAPNGKFGIISWPLVFMMVFIKKQKSSKLDSQTCTDAVSEIIALTDLRIIIQI